MRRTGKTGSTGRLLAAFQPPKSLNAYIDNNTYTRQTAGRHRQEPAGRPAPDRRSRSGLQGGPVALRHVSERPAEDALPDPVVKSPPKKYSESPQAEACGRYLTP